jgi:threonine/homoserine/homoserine lactone efflux protein
MGLALLIWPIALGIAAWLAATSDMIANALVITAGAFLLALAYLGWSTWLTARRDRMAAAEARSGRP